MDTEIHPKPVTRRKFLDIGKKAAVGTASAALLQGLDPIASLAKSPEQTKTSPLKESIEQEFGVRIGSAYEALQAGGSDWRSFQNPGADEKSYYEDLNEEELKNIKEFLPLLPSHFYKREDGRKLWITKGGEYPTGRSTPIPQVGIGVLDSQERRYFFAKLTHEIIHTLNISNDFSLLRDPKFQQAVGGDYFTFKEDFEQKLRPKLEPLETRYFDSKSKGGVGPDLTEEELVTLKRYTQLSYSIGSFLVGKGPGEFLPVLTEVYLNGEDYFTKTFGEFFPSERVTNLYDFMKNSVFKGAEYNHFLVHEQYKTVEINPQPFFGGLPPWKTIFR